MIASSIVLWKFFTINVYNTVPVVVPDTLSVTYLTIIIGILLIGVGGFILYKKGYEKI